MLNQDECSPCSGCSQPISDNLKFLHGFENNRQVMHGMAIANVVAKPMPGMISPI